eukprot:11184840-Lingulodinium_polyedra.AAC.1
MFSRCPSQRIASCARRGPRVLTPHYPKPPPGLVAGQSATRPLQSAARCPFIRSVDARTPA